MKNGRRRSRTPLLTTAVLACSLLLAPPLAAETVEVNVPMSLDGRVLGEIAVRIEEAESRLSGVHRGLFDAVAAVARLPLRQGDQEWWSVEELAAEGFFLSFDVAAVSVKLDLDPNLRLLREHHMRASYSLEQVTAKSEQYAGGINLYTRSVYEKEAGATAVAEATPEFLLRLEPFLNVKTWVVEGDVRYDTSERKPLEATEYRLVHDLKPMRLRLEAGTLRYPTIADQGRRDILGVAVSRRFDLEANGGSRRNRAEFFLDRGDTVTVYLNDQRVFSEYLPPGPHLLEGLMLSPGRNELRVESGGETKFLIIPHDSDLLRKGLSDMAVAAGVLQEEMAGPAGGAFYRYGLTDHWSAGLYTHADPGTQMAGLESVNAFAIGTFKTTLAGSRARTDWAEMEDDARWGYRGSLTYRLSLPGSVLSSIFVSCSGFSRFYSSAGEIEAENQYMGDGTTSFGVRLGRSANASLALRGRLGYEEEDNSASLSISGRTRFGKSLQFFAGLRFNLTGDDSTGTQGTLTLTYYPQRRPNLRSSVTQSIGEPTTSLSLAGDGSKSGSGFRWSAAATRAAEDEAPYRLDDSVRYGGNRGELQFRSYVETGDGEVGYRVEGGGETALLFAGKTAAIGRPVRDSFVLLRKHEALGDAIVGVRMGETWNQRTGRLGPAAVGGYSSYRFQRLNIDVDKLPSEVDLGTLSHLLFPSYRSGYALTVGKGPAIYAGGVLADETGAPLVLSLLEARLVGAAETIRFFTDENGMFEVYGLKPGEWDVVLPKSGLHGRLVIPPDAVGFVDLGTMMMEEP